MKKFSIKNLEFIPASHEDPNDPGVLKKVIFTKDDVEIKGTVQMINWAKMGPGKNFALHYHENMDEIFIILSGKGKITLNEETIDIEKTDTIYIPAGTRHEMVNLSEEDMDYIAMGVVTKPGGKTIVVE